MIVILKGQQSNGDGFTRFGWTECDVEGCGKRAPKDVNLVEIGWFIAPGQHRCPAHADVDAPARGPQYRDEDVTTKVI